MENNNLNNRKAPWLGRNIFGFLLGMLMVFNYCKVLSLQ